MVKLSTAQDQEVKWSPGQATPKPLRPLTRKQQAFVQHLINNPKESATKAVEATYNVGSNEVARNIASDNLTKPNIMLELSKHSATAELVILEVLEQSRKRMLEDKPRAVDWANSARQTADSLLDRVHGKATTRIESTSTSVTLNIDLTGATSPGNI